MPTNPIKVALITGAARRIGAVIAHYLHQQGMNVVIHYRSSQSEAEALVKELNSQRANSAIALRLDLAETEKLPNLISQTVQAWGRLDVLVNNASDFYPTPIGQASEDDWNDLLASNLKGPFFLSQAAASQLAKTHGSIVNISAIHAERPLKNYPIYNIAKAGLNMLTKTLAKELGPEIRVNAVAPGTVLWPEDVNALENKIKEKLIEKTLLKKQGTPEDIAKAVWFLIHDSDFITGQILTVDGGRVL